MNPIGKLYRQTRARISTALHEGKCTFLPESCANDEQVMARLNGRHKGPWYAAFHPGDETAAPA